MKIAAAAVFLVALPLAAQAQTQVLPVRPLQVCLQQNMVWGWNVVDDKTPIVTDRLHEAYKVSLMAGCYDLKFQLRLSLRSFSGMSLSCLSRNDYVLVPPNAGMPAQRCLISDVAAFAPPPK
jgi:hypothetical protein